MSLDLFIQSEEPLARLKPEPELAQQGPPPSAIPETDILEKDILEKLTQLGRKIDGLSDHVTMRSHSKSIRLVSALRGVRAALHGIKSLFARDPRAQ